MDSIALSNKPQQPAAPRAAAERQDVRWTK